MKALFLSNGNSIHTQRWVTWLSEAGWDVELITTTPLPEIEDFSSIKQHILPKIPFGYTSRLWSLFVFIKILIYVPLILKIMRRVKPNIMLAHEIPTWGVYTGFAKMINRKNSSMCVSWGFSKMKEPEIIRTFVERVALKHIDYVRAQCKSIGDALFQYRKVPTKKLLVKTWGIDTKIFFDRTDKEKEITRKRFDLEGKRVVLSPRFITPYYNIDTILKAIKIVSKRVQNASCIFLSGSSDESHKREMISLSKELEIDDITIFLKSHIPPEEVSQYLSISDMSIMVPNTDQGSASLLEAMACGVIPICTDLPANREWIEHGKNGYLVEPDDYETLATHIIDILTTGGISEEMRKRNIEVIMEKADWYKNMAEIEQEMRNIILRKT